MFKLSVQNKNKRMSFYRFHCPHCGIALLSVSTLQERTCYSCSGFVPNMNEIISAEAFRVMMYRSGKYPLVPSNRGKYGYG